MIPKKVVIAGIGYEVKEVDDLATEHGLGGQILYEKGIIKIDSAMSEDKKEQVLIHEVLHGIFDQSGFDNQEEDTVNRLSIVLYQVIKDNEFNFTTADTAEG